MPSRLPAHAPVLRLFVAVYPPPEAVPAMLALLDALPLPKHRPTPPAQLHMTLQFVGDRHERELDAVAESVDRSAAGIPPFDLTPRALIPLPERGPARLVALETDAPPGLMEIQRRLAHRLADPGRRSKGRFTPHLTLCRFQHEERIPPLHHPVHIPPFRVTAIHLMSSILRPAGAEHRPVHTTALAANRCSSPEQPL